VPVFWREIVVARDGSTGSGWKRPKVCSPVGTGWFSGHGTAGNLVIVGRLGIVEVRKSTANS